ncbi:MAG: hypothetical protein EBV30_09875, partial [Actinobacteria bacterium]|nr:hypothetical protein [Actinomycetota bacterium]
MVELTSPFTDKICYYLNSGAVGDLVAASAVIQHAIETYHKPRNVDYRVAMQEHFRDLLPQVPDEKITDLEGAFKLDGFAIRMLNMTRPVQLPNVAILTPSRFHLVQYASVGLLARVVPLEKAPYVPLKEVSVTKFGIPFDKAVVLVVTYRDASRMWPGEEIKKTAKAVSEMGLTPVYVGKTGAIANWKEHLAKTEFEYPGFGINLIDKTTLAEMASIMGKSRVVVGMDSGPLHVAMSTNAPVVMGFTNVSPDLRIPYRKEAPT